MRRASIVTVNCEKLPTRLEYSLFRYDWTTYKEGLYRIFQRDFLNNEIEFNGKRVDIIHEKFFEGKERSFWHIISEGMEDVNRSPNADRCASISWVKPLIEDDGSCISYRLWVKYHDKTKRDRYYIWCTAANYMVILEDRDSHYKLITAYNVLSYKIKGYEKEYNNYIKTKTPT